MHPGNMKCPHYFVVSLIPPPHLPRHPSVAISSAPTRGPRHSFSATQHSPRAVMGHHDDAGASRAYVPAAGPGQSWARACSETGCTHLAGQNCQNAQGRRCGAHCWCSNHSRRSSRRGPARGTDAPSRSAARFAMRHSAILRATTENALAIMQTVGLERARQFPSLTKEPDRARRWLIKLALMRMTTEHTMPDGAYPALPVLDWLSSFDNAVHPALLDAIAQAAAAVLTPARAAELGHQLVTSAAEAFARTSCDRPSWRATTARASSAGRQRSADTARQSRAGGNVNIDDTNTAKHARSRSVPPRPQRLRSGHRKPRGRRIHRPNGYPSTAGARGHAPPAGGTSC